jgi:outer membrane protein assembly factor BamB
MLRKPVSFPGAVLLFILALLLGWIVVTIFKPSSGVQFAPGPTLTPAPSRAVIANNLGLHEIWRRTIGPTYGSTNVSVPVMAVADHTLVMPVMPRNGTRVIALDARDGQPLWSLRVFTLDVATPPISVDTLYADAELVYIAVPYKIFGTRLRDGSLVWETEELPGHTGYFIYPEINSNTLQVHSDEVKLYSIQADTGQIKSVQKYPDGFLFEVSGASYSTTPIELICTDASSGQQRWKISTSGSVRRWPVFFQPDLMIFEAGWGTASTLAAVNTAAGNILWQTPRDIASNFVVQGNAVYSIDINGVLTTRDAVDGREVGQMKFSGAPLDVDHATQYWVAASDSMLFVYFGDSQELIAFVRD